jgi:hypothetical protein
MTAPPVTCGPQTMHGTVVIAMNTYNRYVVEPYNERYRDGPVSGRVSLFRGTGVYRFVYSDITGHVMCCDKPHGLQLAKIKSASAFCVPVSDFRMSPSQLHCKPSLCASA